MNQSIHPNPCPFCTSSVIKLMIAECYVGAIPHEIPTTKKAYWLECATCQSSGPVAGSENEAAQKWGMKSDDL